MSRVTVELDFFRMEKDATLPSKSHPLTPAAAAAAATKLLRPQRSFRDIQGAISKINPELLKSVITASGSSAADNGNSYRQFDSKRKSFSVPSTPKEERRPALPVFSPILPPRPGPESAPPAETAPLTIFYNGTVAVFDLSQDKAESILKLAEKGATKTEQSTDPNVVTTDQQELLRTLNGDLPIARKKSLQRFLEKRKERMTLSPYQACKTETRF